MTTKERLLAELDNLEEEDLEILYSVIEDILQKKKKAIQEPHFLERLQQIQIDGPVDFAENLDLYLTGEKKIDDNLP